LTGENIDGRHAFSYTTFDNISTQTTPQGMGDNNFTPLFGKLHIRNADNKIAHNFFPYYMRMSCRERFKTVPYRA
jgi:hypothetical protein